ncbi:MAG TPA: hypothetical protein VFB14_14980 [Bryobacteraceae bacterium]|nr:hypothetical protein [Bryobacteraceae bacterium]
MIRRTLLLLAALAPLATAHVGSPNIYLDGKAGPYQLFVTIRPPTAIPGVAAIEVRSESAGVSEIRAVPLPMSGPGAKFAPVPDKLTQSREDPQFFTGSLWMMATGSWEVRLTVNGARGRGAIAVPVPAAAQSLKKMNRGLGALLGVLMLFLVFGAVAMVGASVREARLEPGAVPDARNTRRARIAMAVTFAVVLAVLWLGNRWWSSEQRSYANNVYKPLAMSASVDPSGVLTLNLSDPGWLRRTFDDLVPDHNHLMHLYAIRQPGMDAVYHLHPDQVESGLFRLDLPRMQPGTYKLYADIVHANGFPETMVTSVGISALPGRPLTGDDAAGCAPPWNAVSSTSTVFALPDGYRMEWLRGTEALRANEPRMFRFRLEDPHGQPPRDMAFYMGMLGHAAFVKTNGTVFAHIHPTGSVSMAAFMMAQGMMPDMNMETSESSLPNTVGFPYGFPSPGRYRIIVQMKHGETVETGIFDANIQ